MESSTNKDSISHISLSDSIERQHITDINLITLECALPLNYNYVIDSFKAIQALKFLGAFSEQFEAKFCVNIYTADKNKVWLEEFSDYTRPRCKKHEDTEYSAILSTILSIQLRNISNTYPCIISLLFHHNHLLTSSYAMSFQPICNETKDAFFALFHVGHGPASAYYTYTEEIQLKYDNDKEVLANRAICPQKHDIYYLHKKFLDQSVGAKNGKEMFSQLAKEVEEFNTNERGCDWMQPYIAPTSIEPGQLLVLVVITNLMKHCYSLQQAGELIYIDTTAGLDAFNTPLTLLSTTF
ncbi:hypothetical protein F8M41_021559 [Gigaspora margarita]|uniref:Uncharacterized protein n=1 Tax=Gigaspora margarita TaxID=4874 RepID=A0A8H4AGL9_GIGMA|nr:hypothetical protein F8M41_021559 [Gigaspora margarita]